MSKKLFSSDDLIIKGNIVEELRGLKCPEGPTKHYSLELDLSVRINSKLKNFTIQISLLNEMEPTNWQEWYRV